MDGMARTMFSYISECRTRRGGTTLVRSWATHDAMHDYINSTLPECGLHPISTWLEGDVPHDEKRVSMSASSPIDPVKAEASPQ
jgi:hypothetical protein